MRPCATSRTAATATAAEPADARADAVLVALAAADRDDEPAERLLDGDRQRGGLEPVGQRDVGVDRPAELRAAERLEAVGQVGVLVGDEVGAARPTPRSSPAAHDAWRRISPVGSAVGMSTGAPLPVEPSSRS